MRTISILLFLSVFLWAAGIKASETYSAAPADGDFTRQQVEKPVRDAISVRQNSQRQREAWSEQELRMLEEIERLSHENSALSKRADELSSQIEASKQRISRKKEELSGIRQISRDMEPFIEETLGWLKEAVAEDLPFLQKERSERLSRLERLMNDPDVSLNEKFRRVMEAMFIEAEYGTTVEVTGETVEIGGEPVMVNVFRLGRLNLFYETLDQSGCGFYNVASRRWEGLPRRYSRDIRHAFEMALKQRPVALVTLPVGKVVSR